MEEKLLNSSSDRTEEYLSLLNQFGKKLNAYVFSLVKDVALGEDILQETRLLMWQNFDQYTSNTNFLAWARKMAFHQILSHRRKVKRKPSCLTDEIINSISEDIASFDDDQRQAALSQCLNKLSETHRKIISLRYYDNLEITAIAEIIKRPEGGIYRVLSRIRTNLNKCIQHNISGGIVS